MKIRIFLIHADNTALTLFSSFLPILFSFDKYVMIFRLLSFIVKYRFGFMITHDSGIRSSHLLRLLCYQTEYIKIQPFLGLPPPLSGLHVRLSQSFSELRQ